MTRARRDRSHEQRDTVVRARCAAAFGVLLGSSAMMACDSADVDVAVANDPEATDENNDESSTSDAAADDSGSTSDAVTIADDEPRSVCDEHAACFSWCGVAFLDGSCEIASDTSLEASNFGPVLCDPLVLEVDAGRVRLAEGATNDDARCFLQVLRYGHMGVAELRWRETGTDRVGHLVVEGVGGQYAGLHMLLHGVEPTCGSVVALTATRAHVRAERDPLFDACLDSLGDVDLEACVLGPAADFYTHHDWVFEVAFPWLSGTCGVG